MGYNQNKTLPNESLMKKAMHVTSTKKPGTKYLAVPHHPNMMTSIRFLLKKLKIKNVSIAPRISIKNRSHIWTNTKDKKKLSGTINSSFLVKCQHCNFKWSCKTKNLDVARTASHHFNNKFSLPFRHANENKSHKMIIDLKSIKIFKSKRELELYKSK